MSARNTLKEIVELCTWLLNRHPLLTPQTPLTKTPTPQKESTPLHSLDKVDKIIYGVPFIVCGVYA